MRDTGIGLTRRRHGPAVPVVLAGRLVDHAQVRRHRPRPRDQQAARRADGRHDVGRERRARARARRSTFTIEAPVAELPPSAAARLRRRAARAAGQARAGRRRQRDQPPRARAADGQVGHGVARHRVARARRCAGSTAASAFDLAILDMHMPEMDGARAGARASAQRTPTLPLVLFSSLGRREAGDTEALFDAYLAKPLRQSQLFDTLVGAARARRARRRPRRRAGQAAARPEHGGAPSAAHPARRGQRREPEARAAPAAADGLPRRPRVATASRRSSRSSARPTTSC